MHAYPGWNRRDTVKKVTCREIVLGRFSVVLSMNNRRSDLRYVLMIWLVITSPPPSSEKIIIGGGAVVGWHPGSICNCMPALGGTEMLGR